MKILIGFRSGETKWKISVWTSAWMQEQSNKMLASKENFYPMCLPNVPHHNRDVSTDRGADTVIICIYGSFR